MWNIIYGVFICTILTLQISDTEAQTTSVRKQKCNLGNTYITRLSCLSNPCIYSSCPAYGKLAECRKELYNDCTCRAAYFVNGRRVNCHSKKFDCPPGLPLQHCDIDPCSSTTCHDPRFKGAECRPYYCGGCLAQYYVDREWKQCPSPDVKLQGDAPLLTSEIERAMREFPAGQRNSGSNRGSSLLRGVCSDGTAEPECPADVCTRASCPQFTLATCVVNKCGGCKAEFYYRGQLVDCQSTKCRPNTLEMSCPDDPCKYAKCPQHRDAVCRTSNCGTCHAEWFLNNKKVQCYKTLPSDFECPNGKERQICPANTCRFKKCLTNSLVNCRINNCGGCYAEYLYSDNTEATCRGWWNLYEKRLPTNQRVKTAPQSNMLNRQLSARSKSTRRNMVRATAAKPTNAMSKSTSQNLANKPKPVSQNTAKSVKSTLSRNTEVDTLLSDLNLNDQVAASKSKSQIETKLIPMSTSQNVASQNSNKPKPVSQNTVKSTVESKLTRNTEVDAFFSDLNLNDQATASKSKSQMETKSSKKLNREQEVDAFFSQFNLEQPSNSETLPNDKEKSPPAGNSWNNIVSDNKQPTDQREILDSRQRGPQSSIQTSNQNSLPVKQNTERSMSSMGSPIQQDNQVAKVSNIVNSGHPTSPKSKVTMNEGQRTLPKAIPLVRSISIPLDSLNKKANFRPGIPIGGWNKQQRRR